MKSHSTFKLGAIGTTFRMWKLGTLVFFAAISIVSSEDEVELERESKGLFDYLKV